MNDHSMIPGSHERTGGAECRCGAVWDRWGDSCTKIMRDGVTDDAPAIQALIDSRANR